VARYAWGPVDYHDLLRARLKRLAGWLTDRIPAARARGVVDTAPLLERAFAQLAGLGWVGKNSMLLDRDLGSWFFLAALLVDLELAYDPPYATDHCGTCTACLDRCPAGAFPKPYLLDARRCISYLTIEHRGSIPTALRGCVGDWLFGCDVCQEVCPWNNRVPASAEPDFGPWEEMNPVDLLPLFDLDDAAFRARFRKTALWRAKRRGLLRNAATVLGNQCAVIAIPTLKRGLTESDATVRAACRWALEQMC
jgi:epoxyqueuosine reductase